MRALVFGYPSSEGLWTYDLVEGTWVGEPDWTTVMCGPWLPTWRAAYDAACTELRKRAEESP